MDIQIDTQSPIRQDVRVTVPVEDVQKAVNKQLSEIGKKAKIQGFRKGKVPMHVLKRQHGSAARFEAIDRIVNTSLGVVLEHEDLKGVVHVSQPDLAEGVKSGPVVFTFIAERLPDIELAGYGDIEVEQENVELDTEKLDARILALQEEHTSVVPVEDRTIVEAEDILIVSYHGRGSETAEKVHAHSQQIDLADPSLIAGLGEALIGAIRGEKKIVEITLPEDFGADELKGQTLQLEVEVEEIKAKSVPKLNDDLAKLDGQYKTLKTLKSNISKELNAEAEKTTEVEAKRRMVKELVDRHNIELPPLYVTAQAQQEAMGRLKELMGQGIDFRQMGLDPNSFAAGLEGEISRAISETLVLRAIAETEDLEATDEDIENWIKTTSESSGQPEPKLRAQLGKEGQMDQLKVRLTFDKVVESVWATTKVTMVDKVAGEEE